VDDVIAQLNEGAFLERSLGSRFAYAPKENGRATLFVDGDGLDTRLEVAQSLADPATPIESDILDDPDVADIIIGLLQRGSLSLIGESDN